MKKQGIGGYEPAISAANQINRPSSVSISYAFNCFLEILISFPLQKFLLLTGRYCLRIVPDLMFKREKNGAITRYKARFVAKGFQQQPCIDFHETLALVQVTTIRGFNSLGVTNDWPLRQLYIHNAILHGNLKEQAPRAWFERLSKALFDLGFKGSKTDPSLFIYSRGDTLLYILVYVDDIIVTGNNKGTIDNIICQLGSAFALKDLGPLNYFLGIEIVPHVSGILLSQKKYILELLQSAGLSNCNPVSSPMVTSSSLSLDDNTAFSNPVKYRQVVGSLQYVTLSRPDIAFVVNKLVQKIVHRCLDQEDILSGIRVFYDTLTLNRIDNTEKCSLKVPYRPTNVLIASDEAAEKQFYQIHESYYSLFYKTDDELTRNNLSSSPIKRTFHFLQQRQPEMVKICTDVKQRQEIRQNANPLALLAAAQPYSDNYYQAPKPQRSSAPSYMQSSSTRPSASTRHKGKEIAKPVTPQSESRFLEKDSDTRTSTGTRI
ncbi:retrovirus-related pol polyprotein from transposon TNT 1-94 [Tanacetum coccineum]